MYKSIINGVFPGDETIRHCCREMALLVANSLNMSPQSKCKVYFTLIKVTFFLKEFYFPFTKYQ